MLWYVMLCYGMYVMVGIYVCMYVCTVHIYYIYTHTHKRTLEYIQLLFGLHSLRHAMIILLSHLMSINYSNWVQPGNHHQTIKPPNHIIKSSNHQLIITIIIIITILLIVATTIQILLSLSMVLLCICICRHVYNILINKYIYMTICQK